MLLSTNSIIDNYLNQLFYIVDEKNYLYKMLAINLLILFACKQYLVESNIFNNFTNASVIINNKRVLPRIILFDLSRIIRYIQQKYLFRSIYYSILQFRLSIFDEIVVVVVVLLLLLLLLSSLLLQLYNINVVCRRVCISQKHKNLKKLEREKNTIYKCAKTFKNIVNL